MFWIERSVRNVQLPFICKKCIWSLQKKEKVVNESMNAIKIEHNVSIERVTKFCYHGDVLSAEGGSKKVLF